MNETHEILQLFADWSSAVESGDPDRIVGLYAADAIFFPTLSPRIRRTPAEIRDYFTGTFLHFQPRCTLLSPNIRICGEIAINSGIYEFSVAHHEEPITGRFTFVYRRDREGWKIIEHHSSALPVEPLIPGGPLIESVDRL